MYLFVKQTVDDEEEGALLGVQNYKQDLKEKVCLVETQNPGTAQYDKLSHNLEQNQPAEEKRDFEVDVCFSCSCQSFVENLVSLDWEMSLLMLARVGLRHQRVAQNKSQFILKGKKNIKVRQSNCEDP